MPERLESIEKAVENLQSVNKDLIDLLEAKEQECNDLLALLNSTKVYNEPSVSPVKSKFPKSTLLPTCKHQPVPRKRISLKKLKPKITHLGSSIARNSGAIISLNSSNKDTCGYSVSGLSLDKSICYS